MSAHQSAIPSNLSNEIEDEIKYIVYGVADMSDLDHEVEADIAIDRLTTLFNKQIVAELKGVLHTPKNSGKEEYILKRIKELERGAE